MLEDTVLGNWEQYLDKLKNPNQWIDEQVVMACAYYLGETIQVITSFPSVSPQRSLIMYPESEGNGTLMRTQLYVGHVYESHYESLKPIGTNAWHRNVYGFPAPTNKLTVKNAADNDQLNRLHAIYTQHKRVKCQK